MPEILLHRFGLVVAQTIVDDDDHGWLTDRTWRLSSWGYAVSGPGRAMVFMHRLILGCERGDGVIVDHVNRDKLDNRRANLRRASKSLNASNTVRSWGESGRRGVYYDKRRGYWRAYVVHRGKHVELGRFDTADEATVVAEAGRNERIQEETHALAD